MKNTDREPNEESLRALFDATADDLDGPGLTRQKARAADIPQRRRRPLWWRAWAPALALAAGALLVLGVRSMNHSEAPTVAETAVPVAPAPSVTQTTRVAEAKTPPASSDDLEPDDLGEDSELALDDADDVGFDEGGDDLLAFGVPSSDDEVEQWLEATDELLGEGG